MALPLPSGLSGLSPRTIGSGTPPETLHHYTSAQGLLGILSTGAVWATDLRYLNDPEEFRFARCLIATEARRRLETVEVGLVREILSGAVDDLEAHSMKAYVVSFSENGNLLSQWRAYAQRDGFSIGFDSGALKGVKGCDLVKCLYWTEGAQTSERMKAVHSFLDAWSATRSDSFTELAEAKAQGNSDFAEFGCRVARRFLMQDLVRLALVIKHPSYEEEREWRLMFVDRQGVHRSGGGSGSSQGPHVEGTSFRQGVFGLTPYRTLRVLGTTSMPAGVREVTVGPTPYPNEALNAATELVRAHCSADVIVKVCGIPYRAW